MSDQYVDPFEAFKRKKMEAEAKGKGEISKAEGPPVPEEIRPKGFTTNRYERKKLIPVPKPDSSTGEGEDQIFFPEDAEELLKGDKPKGFVTHHHKTKGPPKPDELKKPKGFQSHRWA